MPIIDDEGRLFGYINVVDALVVLLLLSVLLAGAVLVTDFEVSPTEPSGEDYATLTLDVASRQRDGTLRFHGRPVEYGDAVTLDFGTVTVTGTVTGLAVEQ